MYDFLGSFGAYDFAVREGLALLIVAFGVYILLNAGIFAVPQVGLMAVGSYVAAVLSVDAQWPFPLALASGAVAAMVVGAGLARILGKLNGIYLAIATIAFSEVVRVAVLNIPITGQSQGKVGIPREANDLYLVISALAMTLALWALSRSRFGLATIALREDPLMAKHQGLNVVGYRVALFAISGLLCGVGGALYVHMTGFVEPGQFSFDLLTRLISIVVIGGTTYVFGPWLGALVIIGLPNALDAFANYQVLVNGILIVLVISFAPRGLMGLFDALRRRTSNREVHYVRQEEVPTHSEPVDRQAPANVGANRTAVEISGIAMSFGGIRALQSVSMSVRTGEILGVIGPNGSGKSTLLNVLSGVYTPTSGTGTLFGEPLEHLWGRAHQLARKGIARTFQTIRLIDTRTVFDNVMVGVTRSSGGGRAAREAVVRETLRSHGLGQFAADDAGMLPYGVRRRVEIARALVARPKVLLLDEPTAGMNPTERAEVFQMVSTLRREGIAVILVEHDVAMMAQYCDRLVVLDFGVVIADGSADVVLSTEEVIAAYVGSSAHR